MKYIDIVDENNNETGEKVELDNVFKIGLWHREVSVFLLNENNEILLQKRPKEKIRKPNIWTVCSGIVGAGEDVISAAMRKLKNELVIYVSLNDLELIEIAIETNKLGNEINNNFRYIYLLKTDKKIDDFNINPKEVSNLKYISIDKLNEMIKNNDENLTFSCQDYMKDIVSQIKVRTK